MPSLGNAQVLVMLALWVAAAVVVGSALLHAVRQPAQAFTALSARLGKQAWVIILSVSALLLFVTFPNVLNLFALAATIAGIVYTVDTKVKLKQLRGGGSSSGPYGGW